VWADVFLALAVVRLPNVGWWRECHILLDRALDLARRLDDPDALWLAAWFWLFYVQAPQHAKERLQLAQEFAARPRARVSNRILGPSLLIIGDALLASGGRTPAEAVWARRTRQSHGAGERAPECDDRGGRARYPGRAAG